MLGGLCRRHRCRAAGFDGYVSSGANTSSTKPAGTPRRRRRTRRTHLAALLALRDQVIAPFLAGIRNPHMGRKPAHWTRVDRDYERIRIDTQMLVSAIETPLAA